MIPVKTDIILADIVGYSSLSDENQFLTAIIMTEAVRETVRELIGRSFSKFEDIIQGMMPAGDGFYIMLNPGLSGYGLLLTLSLRSYLLKRQSQTRSIFRGARFCIHTADTIEYEDVQGRPNFCGNGLNDCARILSLTDVREHGLMFAGDRSFIIASHDALAQFFSLYGEPVLKFLQPWKFRASQERRFTFRNRFMDCSFIEVAREVTLNPPDPYELQKMLTGFSGAVIKP